MEAQIEKIVKTCSPCAFSAKLPNKNLLHSWPQSTKHGKVKPINKVFHMPTTSSQAVISKLKSLFACHGLPETIVSDNGTQFSSNLYRQFCKSKGVEHPFSPAYHPQSNGQAKGFVATFKNALFKLKKGRNLLEAIEFFLLSYLTTPCASAPNCLTSAEAFLGLKLRATLDLLLPNAA
uniref:Integrase catalytic domain-containing protein n=1 Tax=Ditylenchus dipsaci TaxID=166011 RepID=A0A915EMK8_9BILA